MKTDKTETLFPSTLIETLSIFYQVLQPRPFCLDILPKNEKEDWRIQCFMIGTNVDVQLFFDHNSPTGMRQFLMGNIAMDQVEQALQFLLGLAKEYSK